MCVCCRNSRYQHEYNTNSVLVDPIVACRQKVDKWIVPQSARRRTPHTPLGCVYDPISLVLTQIPCGMGATLNVSKLITIPASEGSSSSYQRPASEYCIPLLTSDNWQDFISIDRTIPTIKWAYLQVYPECIVVGLWNGDVSSGTYAEASALIARKDIDLLIFSDDIKLTACMFNRATHHKCRGDCQKPVAFAGRTAIHLLALVKCMDGRTSNWSMTHIARKHFPRVMDDDTLCPYGIFKNPTGDKACDFVEKMLLSLPVLVKQSSALAVVLHLDMGMISSSWIYGVMFFFC